MSADCKGSQLLIIQRASTARARTAAQLRGAIIGHTRGVVPVEIPVAVLKMRFTAFASAVPLSVARARSATDGVLERRPAHLRAGRFSGTRSSRVLIQPFRLRASTAAPDLKAEGKEDDRSVPDPFLAGRAGAVCPEADWTPSKTTGAAAIARSRNIDVDNVSRCYGMILGSQMLQLGIEDLMPECIIDGIHEGWNELDSPMDVARFESMLQSMMSDGNEDGSPNGSGSEDAPVATMSEMLALSRMYGFLLGTTLRMSCLELALDLVEAGFRTRCAEPDLPMPLDESVYDRMFMEIQQIAAALMHDANKDDADRFFGEAANAPDMMKVNASVMYLDGRFKAPNSLKTATIEDTVQVVISGRLLDGRAFLVSTYSDGVENEADSVSIPLPGIPESLSCGIVGMRVGEVRTLYIHPNSTDGVSALFSAQPFPPQSLLIFDVKLLAITEKEQEAKNTEA